jgi:hypothetical protein
MTSAQQVGLRHPDGPPARHEPVFLLAPARSFTTVTVALLAGHPDIYGFPELGLFTAATVGELIDPARAEAGGRWFAEFKRNGILRAVADLREGSQDQPAISRAEKWLTERSSWTPRQLMDYLLELAYPQIGLEKSPETTGSGDALDACVRDYPNAVYVHLTRHPVSTMRSMREHWRHIPGMTEKRLTGMAATGWYLSHARIVRKLAAMPAGQWTRIRTEDLLRDPRTRLPKLLTWLGLRTDDDMVARMTHTENWRFANTGPSGKLFGGDPKFMRSPILRPVAEPGEITFDQSWGLTVEISARITALASQLGY